LNNNFACRNMHYRFADLKEYITKKIPIADMAFDRIECELNRLASTGKLLQLVFYGLLKAARLEAKQPVKTTILRS